MSPLLLDDNAPTGVQILDIRADKHEKSLLDMVHQSLHPAPGTSKTMPTLLLYDEKGLKLFEKITYLDEYYLTNAEIDALTTHADTIIARIPAGARLVELGSGNLRKVNILLAAFERAEKAVEYYALDLSLPELHRTFAELDTNAYKYVSFHGLHGTYDDGLAWLSKDKQCSKSLCILTLGSSLGNFNREEASQFLVSFARILGPEDSVLVGLDACQDSDRVYHAYNDRENVTEQFYRNGLEHANKLLGYEAFKQDEWGIEGRYIRGLGKHQASYVALRDINNKDLSIKRGETLHLEDAYKYSKKQSDALWQMAELIHQQAFANASGDYHVHYLTAANVNPTDKNPESVSRSTAKELQQLSTASVTFSHDPEVYAANPLPSLREWENLWTAWDLATQTLVPADELLNKPIQLRNALQFYIGHIPAFADIHYVKATGENPTHPAKYHQFFERGIDPDVDNPEKCHAHSEVPDTWPPLDEMLDYQDRVRDRIRAGTRSLHTKTNRRLARGLWLAYEHEAMHLETFLYMLLYSDKLIPPPGEKVDFRALSEESARQRVPNKWHHVPAAKVVLGMNDPENDLEPDRYFGWDIERPALTVPVKSFQAQSRSISNGEYARFLEATDSQPPASWTTLDQTVNGTNGVNGTATSSDVLDFASPEFIAGKAIRTVYGSLPLKYVLDWPIMASYDELAAFAKWSDARIPTIEEARSIYAYVESQKAAAEHIPSQLISGVNGHLSNEGVQETPPSNGSIDEGAANGSSLNPKDLFIDLSKCNVGFRNWHPTAVTGKGDHLCGQSDVGGLWEWTSTLLAAFEGYKPMDLYPGYSADFFDEKHHICVGGSWATAPRLAGRKSFVNFFQHNYPYVWCTARLVKDID